MCKELDKNKDSLLIFLHIVKAGGTTLRWAMEDQYPFFRTLRCYDSQGCTLDTLMSISKKKKEQYQFFSTHYGFGTHELFPQTATYLTMLREPVARSISQYYSFIYQRPEVEKDLGMYCLEDYVEKMAETRHDNVQVRFVANARDDDIVTAEHLETAKKNIADKFSGIGLMERFEESLALYSKIYGWRNITYIRRNTTKAKPIDIQLDQQHLETIREYNKLDEELYEFSAELFDSLLKKHAVTNEDVERVLKLSSISKARLYFSRGFQKMLRKLFRLQ
jgi:Galactose-3-O-sulfotransferase